MSINPAVTAKFRSRMMMISDSKRWRNEEPLIALDHQDYSNTLETYVNSVPKVNVLMIHGLKAVGKSRQILLKIDKWRSEDYLVLDIYLKDRTVSTEEVLKLLFVKYCQEIGKKGDYSSVEKILEEGINSFFDDKYKKISSMMEKINAALKTLPSSDHVGDEKVRVALNSIDFMTTVTGIIVDEFNEQETRDSKVRYKFSSFLNNLEKEASKGKKIILIICEAQKLVDKSLDQDAQRIFHNLFQCFEEYKYGNRKVSVIIESSELINYVSSSPQSYRRCRVDSWSKEVGYQEAVVRHNVFTKEEYEVVWDVVGGHAGQMYALHEFLRDGRTLSDAIQSLNIETAKLLTSIVEGRQGVDSVAAQKSDDISIINRRDFLTQLTMSNFKIARNEVTPEQQDVLKYLCTKNVLWIDGNSVIPIHQTYRNVMEREYGFAKTLSKEEACKLVVNKFQLFTKDEFEGAVWYTAGGNIGQIFEMHRLLQLGKSMDQTMVEMTNESLRTLDVALKCEKGPDFDSFTKKGLLESKATDICARNREYLLKRLKKCNFVIAGKRISPDHKLSMKYLCVAKVLKEDGLNIVPIHQSMQRAIVQYFMAEEMSSVSPFERFMSLLNFLNGIRLNFLKK